MSKISEKLFEYFQVIGEINKIIDNSKTIDEAFKRCLKLIIDSFDVDNAIVWYKDKDEILHPYYSICSLDLTNKECPAGKGIVGKVYSTQEPVAIIDYKNAGAVDGEDVLAGVEISSMIVAPISNSAGKVGAVQYIKTSGMFDDEQASILQIISDLAIVKINDSDLFDQVHKKQEILLSIKNAQKEFKNGETISKVLKGINLDIYKGEFIVLLGESGCGKSTLLNAIGGMDKLTDGSIIFDGIDLTNANEKELTEYRRKHVGFIFQSYNLMPNLNAKENIDLIAELVKEPKKTEEVLQSVGLEEKEKSYPSQLSGGQQQRISIARALVKNPTIIMADEPTAALDYETSVEVLSALEKVAEEGTTLVMVTHNTEIAKMADRVVRLRNGQVYEITVNRHKLHAKELVW